CGPERTCTRVQIIKTGDGIGVLAKCDHRVINGLMGPPIHGTCQAEMAVVDDEVWVIAATRTLSAHIPSCTLFPICCMLAMPIEFSIFKQRDFIRDQNKFVRELLSQMQLAFGDAPWHFKNLAFKEGVEEFSAISNRRRSALIDGYEDLYLSVRPSVRF